VESFPGVTVIILRDREVAVLADWLPPLIRAAPGARGKLAPPVELVDLANQISQAARSSAQFRADAQVSGAPGTARFRSDPAPPGSGQEPATLTVREAALRAQVSEGLVRRLCRRGDVTASQRRGAWAIETRSLTTWASSRRKEQERTRRAA
jgi:hypothetical protein